MKRDLQPADSVPDLDLRAPTPRPSGSLARWCAKRVLWACVTLFGISLLTFACLDLAPGNRIDAAAHAADAEGESLVTRVARAERVRELGIRYGMVDPATGEPFGLMTRYGAWCSRAVRLELAGPGERDDDYRARIARAMPTTMWLGSLALVLALAVALPLGAAIGRRRARAGGAGSVSGAALFVLQGMPTFVLATLLVLMFGGAWGIDWLPVNGLASNLPVDASVWTRFFDHLAHLILPVVTLAVGPCVLIALFLAESMERTERSEPMLAARALGLPQRVERRRALRLALSPVATLMGGLLPLVISGSVVVETVFSIDGMGRLIWDALRAREEGLIMALTLLTSAVSLAAFVVSDLLQRLLDPRVDLS